jgi:hypothetical protein
VILPAIAGFVSLLRLFVRHDEAQADLWFEQLSLRLDGGLGDRAAVNSNAPGWPDACGTLRRDLPSAARRESLVNVSSIPFDVSSLLPSREPLASE